MYEKVDKEQNMINNVIKNQLVYRYIKFFLLFYFLMAPVLAIDWKTTFKLAKELVQYLFQII